MQALLLYPPPRHLPRPSSLPGRPGLLHLSHFSSLSSPRPSPLPLPLLTRRSGPPVVAAVAAAEPSNGATPLPPPPPGALPAAKVLGVEVTTLKKVVPLGLMFFCILFNYTILRDTKDVLVITAKGSSAEIIPFLKTWVNLPMAIGFMLLYTKLSNVLSREQLFYTCMFPFIAFFGAFAFLLYPNSHLIHPVGIADWLLRILGPSFFGPIAIFRIWSFCLFYVMSELWGSVVVSLLFWGFANQVSSCLNLMNFFDGSIFAAQFLVLS